MKIFTTCPESYDGFGTKTVEIVGSDRRGNPIRLVNADPNHSDWQISRYRSGAIYLVADETAFEELVSLGFATVE